MASVVMKPIGGTVHLRRGTVRRGIVGWLMVGSIPNAFARRDHGSRHRTGGPQHAALVEGDTMAADAPAAGAVPLVSER